MKLYTINATPVRKFKQLTDNEQRAIRNSNSLTLAKINANAIADYPERVAEILATSGIDGFTIYQVQGYWKGESEISFKIEIATDDETITEWVAGKLKDCYNQESVMLTKPDNTVDFI